MKFLKVQSALPRSGSLLWLVFVFFPLKSADVSGAGTHDEPLRTSAWKATAARVSQTWRSWISQRCAQMTSQKRDPHRDSDKHWPSLLEVGRTLYGSAQFAISSARLFSVFRSVPISKFEERPWEYNVEQIKTLPVIRDSNTLKLGGIHQLQDQTCFRIAWRLRTNTKCFREVSMIIFLDILKTDSVSSSRRWGVENNENSQNAQGWRLSLPQAKGNVWNRLRFLKKHFMFLEELNRRILENGINLRLSYIYLFQNISRLPDHRHKTQRISLSFQTLAFI